MAKTATTTTKAAKTPAPVATKKKTSPLVPDAAGNYPFILYSVKLKQFVDLAKKPKPTLTPTGRGAYMCKGQSADEALPLAMIISTATAQNWVDRKLAEFVD